VPGGWLSTEASVEYRAVTTVTRFAPSPTGTLHIGGARTALFNWAFARHADGAFFLRFEDTDQARSSEESVHSMLEAMDWMGIDFDPFPGEPDGIPRQSARGEHYRAAVERLLELGHAYRCTCTPEQVDAMRERARAQGRQPKYEGSCRDRGIGPNPGVPFCVRLRVPHDGHTRWNDLIAGPSGQDLDMVDDFVLQRTDGTPIYHLAVVVDDHEMGVTHVIRAREHLTSTSRQLLLYAALEFEVPLFAHVPLLVNAAGKKLSKRDGDVSLQAYRDQGFLAEAMANFVARLGWGHGDLELFDRKEFARLFDLRDIGKSPSQVHPDKLLWINQHYLQQLPGSELYLRARPFLEEVAGGAVEPSAALEKLLELLRVRGKTLVEIAEQAAFMLRDTLEYDPKAARKHLTPQRAPLLSALREKLAETPDTEWETHVLDGVLRKLAEEREVGLGALAQPLRVALVGSAASPGIFETLEVAGKSRTLARLDQAISTISRAQD